MGIERSPSQPSSSSDKAELQDIVTYSFATARLHDSKQEALMEVIADPDSDEIDTHMATIELFKSNLELRCLIVQDGIKLLTIAQNDSRYDAETIEKASHATDESLDWIRSAMEVIESQYGIDAHQIVEKYGLTDLI